MNIDIIRITADVGLFVLIWMVQLLIYPSFLYYKRDNLIKWHEKYTTNISFIVVPLMLGQVAVAAFQLFSGLNLINIAYAILVSCSWVITFIIFVPIHSKISKNDHDKELLKKLVSYNWLRTIIWTIIVVMTCYPYVMT